MFFWIKVKAWIFNSSLVAYRSKVSFRVRLLIIFYICQEVSEVNLNKCDSDSEEKKESETAAVKIKELERKKGEEENNAASSNPPVDEDSDGEIG